MILTNTKPVLLQIYYYRPDHPLIIQEFSWGYEDIIPELRRTHKFLNFWHQNIHAVIEEALISIADGRTRSWTPVDEYIKMN